MCFLGCVSLSLSHPGTGGVRRREAAGEGARLRGVRDPAAHRARAHRRDRGGARRPHGACCVPVCAFVFDAEIVSWLSIYCEPFFSSLPSLSVFSSSSNCVFLPRLHHTSTAFAVFFSLPHIAFFLSSCCRIPCVRGAIDFYHTYVRWWTCPRTAWGS